MKLYHWLIFAVLVLMMVSCRTQKPVGINYLENVRDTTLPVIANKSLLIQKGDILSIKVYSRSTDPRTDIPYNLPEVTGGAASGASSGFLVNETGDIEYPRIGTIHAEGLTKEQLAETIRKEFDTVLKQPSVIVRFQSYKISVLGDVRTPGTYPVPSERITILEAMGLAGDVTDYGRKTNVKVIRETDGRTEIGTIDLTSKDMFTSPYYHLKQNDVVLVETSGKRLKQQEQQNLAQQIGIATSIITTIALILNFIK